MVTSLVSLQYCNRISCTHFAVSLQEFTRASQTKILRTAQNRNPSVCNCRHSKPSAPVSGKCCVN